MAQVSTDFWGMRGSGLARVFAGIEAERRQGEDLEQFLQK